MRVIALVLAYIGIFLLVTVTHLAGLWAYPSPPQSTESYSGGGSDNASSATTHSSTDTAKTNSSKKPRVSLVPPLGKVPRSLRKAVTSLLLGALCGPSRS